MLLPLTTDQTLRISFLLLPAFSNLCLANAVEPLRAANQISNRKLFEFKLLSIDGNPVSSSSGIEIKAQGCARDTDVSDMFVVIASDNYAINITSQLMTILQQAARNSTLIAALDAGSWLLAKAGLLDGYKATIHWQELEHFEEMFLDIEVSTERYVIDRNRITAGGATTTLDLMLRLIRETFGEALSLDVMRHFIYDAERASEDHQRGAISAPFVAREGNVVTAITEMERTIENPRPITEIAEHAGLSPRSLERAFSRNFQLSPSKYYLHLRLSAARRLILETNLSIAEVAERTGFSSASTFARAFSRHFNTPPRDMRRGRLTGSPKLWTRT